MSVEVGQVFAGYTVQRVLGAGGMGRVYLVAHPRLPREDALKVLPAEVTDDPEYRSRFAREADLAAGLSHPHIVRIYDRGEHDGQLWISMDYVAGTDVAQLLGERCQSGMPVDEAVSVVTAVASALDYAHHRGLLHRDVKPANILLTEPDGGQARRIFLADFGIARRMDDSAGLTAANFAVGTVAYAAPEQLRGDPVDGRADQYALACTAFHLLTGAPPYTSTNPTVLITQHVSAPPPSIGARRPELSALDPVFTRALAKNPADRFSNCDEFAAALSAGLTSDPYHTPISLHARLTQPAIVLPVSAQRQRQRPAVWIAALTALAVLTLVGVFVGAELTQPRKPTTPTPVTVTNAAPPTTTAIPRGPITGTYRVDFGAVTDLDGNQAPGAQPSAGSYGVRSVCGGAGCVATAARLTGDHAFASTLVFDQLEGSWLAVALATSQCRDKTGEIWEVFRLQAHPDGTLTGEQTRTSRNNCQERRTVTFTRTGDADAGLPDPATLPPRVPSAAEALHGHYQLTRTFAGASPQQMGNSAITTNCLRTGDRCMSYFHAKSGDVPLVFAGGSFTWDDSSNGKCPDGNTATLRASATFPLPLPVQDPMNSLTGHGHWIQSGACPVSVDFDEVFTRTGD